LDQDFPPGFDGHGMKYSASKILAHQATQDFQLQEEPKFKLITLHPCFVLGDSLIQKTPNDIDGMNALFWASLTSPQPLIPSAFVHVKDVAEAHIKALANHQFLANGTEYILSAPVLGWDNARMIVRDRYPQIAVTLGQGPFPQDDWHVDTSVAEQDLGMQWRLGERILSDTIEQQLALKKQSNL
jgi:nucleoside-diphosphate-sugar epimerase